MRRAFGLMVFFFDLETTVLNFYRWHWSNIFPVFIGSLPDSHDSTLEVCVPGNHCSGKDRLSLAHRLSGEQSRFWDSLGESTNCNCWSGFGTVCHVLGWRLSFWLHWPINFHVRGRRLRLFLQTYVSFWGNSFSVYSDSLASLLWKSFVPISWSPPKTVFSDIMLWDVLFQHGFFVEWSLSYWSQSSSVLSSQQIEKLLSHSLLAHASEVTKRMSINPKRIIFVVIFPCFCLSIGLNGQKNSRPSSIAETMVSLSLSPMMSLCFSLCWLLNACSMFLLDGEPADDCSGQG